MQQQLAQRQKHKPIDTRRSWDGESKHEFDGLLGGGGKCSNTITCLFRLFLSQVDSTVLSLARPCLLLPCFCWISNACSMEYNGCAHCRAKLGQLLWRCHSEDVLVEGLVFLGHVNCSLACSFCFSQVFMQYSLWCLIMVFVYKQNRSFWKIHVPGAVGRTEFNHWARDTRSRKS